MLQNVLIGHLGADAKFNSVNGKDFVSFRIANTDKWTDEAGQTHEKTLWVDCIINGKPRVFEWLKKGQLVCVMGSMDLRIYSSAKEKCLKAGATIAVKQIELLGGKTDEVPSTLYTEDGSKEVRTFKYYYAPEMIRDESTDEYMILMSRNGREYLVDRNGWVKPKETQE